MDFAVDKKYGLRRLDELENLGYRCCNNVVTLPNGDIFNEFAIDSRITLTQNENDLSKLLKAREMINIQKALNNSYKPKDH